MNSRFIRLTSPSSGRPLWIDSDFIIFIGPLSEDETVTTVMFHAGDGAVTTDVSESADEIHEKIVEVNRE